MKHPYLECGKIINTHGFRGALKLESWCDEPQVLAKLKTLWLAVGEGYRAYPVRQASVFRQFVIAELEGVNNEESANALRGKTVYAKREDLPLPPDGFFIADAIGLPAKDADTGEVLGEVTWVETRGRNDLFTVRTPSGEALVPNVPQFVVRVDVEDAVYIHPIPGLLDGGAENV